MSPKRNSSPTEFKLSGLCVEVKSCKVLPPWIAKNEGGATPMKVPSAKGTNGTPNRGAVRFINQFGRMGVILKDKKEAFRFYYNWKIMMYNTRAKTDSIEFNCSKESLIWFLPQENDVIQ